MTGIRQPGELAGKVALVTGAASGIGAAIAALFRAEGATVVGADVAAGTDVVLDVTDEAQWQAVLERIATDHGGLDILVHSAGIATGTPPMELSLDEFRAVHAVNLEGPFIGSRLAVAAMRAKARPAHGVILIVSSVVADVLLEGASAYAISKAAVTNLARAMGVELGRKGDFIRVLAIHPAATRTPMMERVVDAGYWDDPANFADVPLRTYARPEDVAKTALYAASDEAKFLTATVLTVDGGFSKGVGW
jgi:3alpha(or 20beta)-hydroxysteroid dehydrogenase